MGLGKIARKENNIEELTASLEITVAKLRLNHNFKKVCGDQSLMFVSVYNLVSELLTCVLVLEQTHQPVPPGLEILHKNMLVMI